MRDDHTRVTADDGRVAVLDMKNKTVKVNDSDGAELYTESFESIPMAIAISSDGKYVAASTAHPDNAVHIFEPQSGRYLGRKANVDTSILNYMEFGSTDGEIQLETYEVPPDSWSDVHPNRTEVIDTIPVKPQVNVRALRGVGILTDAHEKAWHYISEDELANVDGRLRIPGVSVVTACEEEVTPMECHLIFNKVLDAVQSDHGFCKACYQEAAEYPDEKFEATITDDIPSK
jgi:hypothetical protein